MVTWSCLWFLSELVPTSAYLAWSLTASWPPQTICAWYCFLCLSENWYFEVGEVYICGHLCVTSLLFCNCSPNLWEFFSGWGSAAECHLQLLERQVYSVANDTGFLCKLIFFVINFFLKFWQQSCFVFATDPFMWSLTLRCWAVFVVLGLMKSEI